MDVATLSLNTQLIGKSSQKPAADEKERSNFIDRSEQTDEASILTISPEGQSARVMSLSAKEILARINKQLGLPEEQTESFQNVTPDSTGKFVIAGIKALYERYKKQFGDSLTEDQAKNFFSNVEKGIDSGYNDALGTIKEIGADKITGVMKDVEDARIAINRELTSFREEVMKNFKTSSPATQEDSAPPEQKS
jgi:hypothetical protein